MRETQPQFSITDIPELPEGCVVRLAGELDGDRTAAMDAVFSGLLDGPKIWVVADMSGVTLLASAAIGKLLGAKKRLVEKGGDLVLAAMTVEVKQTLSMMGVNKIFKIYNDLRSASSAYCWEVKHEADRLHLAFPSNLKFVPPVRHFISQVLRNKGYSDRDSFRVETIVDEVCNNAVEYGSATDNSSIVLRMKVNWDRVEIDAENASDPGKIESLKVHMNSLKDPKPFNHDSNSKRGRGLALVKMLASELTADVTPGGTTVHVTKLKEG